MANRTFGGVTLDEFAHRMAVFARDLIRDTYSPTGMRSMRKADNTPVTPVDLAISHEIRKWLKKFHPEAIIIDEETKFPERNSCGGLEAVIDPLDGTLSYILGRADSVYAFAFMQNFVPIHATILAALYYDINQRAREYTATQGMGAFLSGCPISVSPKKSGQRIMLAVSRAEDRPFDGFHLAQELWSNEMVVETLRSVSHECAMLASGHIDGVIFPWGGLHDAVAGDLLVREAGGVTSDLTGQPLDFSKNRVISKNGLPGFIMANNRETFAILLEAVQKHRWKS